MPQCTHTHTHTHTHTQSPIKISHKMTREGIDCIFWSLSPCLYPLGVSFSLEVKFAGADPGFGQGGGPGSEAESCRCSEAESCERSEQCAAGVQALLKGPGSFWVFNAQICILPHSRDSFSLILTLISTPKVNKNTTLCCTSVNLRHSYIYYTYYLIFMKTLCFD